MSQADPTLVMISGLTLILGLVLLCAGIVAYAYSEQRLLSALIPVYYTVYPYRDIAGPLMGVGAVLLVGGLFAYVYVRRPRV